MKVAVISMVPTLGKSSLSVVLGGVFSRSQGRDAVLLSTGNAEDIINAVSNIKAAGDMDNPHILKSLLDNAGMNPKELLNYGIQAGDEHLYIYDILNSTMSTEEKEELFVSAVKTLPADLTLVEICGDVTNEFNRKIMKLCDCSIILTDTSQKCLSEVDNFIKSLPKGNMQLNAALVVSRHDVNVASDKAISSISGKPLSLLFKFPYNPIIGKLSLQGELDKLAYNIVTGDHGVLNLRMPLQELMEFIFNTPKRKLVRSIDRWYR